MAALTKPQWYAKLKSFLPAWWFESEAVQIAVLTAAAAVLAEIDTEAQNHFQETFLLSSTAPIVDGHGDERNVARLSGEPDASYAQRIRYIVNQSNSPALKTLVDALLVRGTSTIREHITDRPFASRGSFMNRSEVYTDYAYNVFTVVIPKQIHAPLSFASRGFFAGRSSFVGTCESSQLVLNQIVEAVNKAKAFGTLYRLTETNE